MAIHARSIAMGKARLALVAFAATLALLSAGCAGTGGGSPLRELWVPTQDEWRAAIAKDRVRLIRKDKSVREIPGALAGRMLAARARLEAAGAGSAELGVAETDDAPNAFAFTYQGRRIVVFTLSWLDRLGNDEDAIAAVMGHELAHLHLGHSPAQRKKREKSAQETGQIAGVLLSLAGVPFGGTIAGNTARAYARSFTRDEERAADALGLKWALAAGYDPCGIRRTVRMFESLSAGPGIPWLSTHPGHAERAESASRAARDAGRPACAD